MKLADRKTKLTFITNGVARYRGKDRAVVVEVQPETALVRLLGTRVRYEISWRGVYDQAARIFAERERSARQLKRRAAKNGGAA